MTEATRQQECLNTLKTFNNTIVTFRLYPANAPQITSAIERGYKAVKHHLRHHGNFTFGIRGTEPELCGDILDQQTVQSISNLVVFRHLALLQAERLTLTPGLDRSQFKKILEVFSAKVDQIKEEGGGTSFVSRRGLDRYFFAPQMEEATGAAGGGTESGGISLAEDAVVRKEFVDVLLGRESRAAIIGELLPVLANPAEGAPILAAAVSGVLEGLLQKKLYVASSALEQILENTGRLIPSGPASQLAAEAGSLLLKNAELPSVVLLMSQNLHNEMGAELSRSLERQISIDQFGAVIHDLRQIQEQLRKTHSHDSRQLQFISEAVERLLATPKGKQFLGQEKARTIIEAGEKARRARRVEAGVKSLLKGNEEVLQSDEFTLYLPVVLQKMAAEGMDREVNALLVMLTSHFQNGDGATRERLSKSLAQIAENLASEKRWDQLKLLAEPLLRWLEYSDNGDLYYEKVCLALQQLMSHSWQSEEYELGDNILAAFYRIRSGAIQKSAAVRTIAGRVQDKGLDRELLGHLLRQCLEAPRNEVLSRRLILQGPLVSRFLVDRLVRTEENTDRVKMIDLLTYGEQFLPPILVEKLAEPMPWYGKRNLLKLLAETGSEEHLEIVFPFLRHDDLRVQREAFICLYKISGTKRKDALIRALSEAGETMKLQVVRALVPFGDVEVARALSQLLAEHKYYSEDFRDTLLANVCLVLARCPYPYSEKALLGFLEQKGQRSARKIGAKVWQTAADALSQVREGQQDERQIKIKADQLRKSVLTKASGPKGAAEKKSITGLAEESAIRDLVANDEKDKARGQLLELIAKISRLRRFTQAEQLRDWLIAIDSQALTDIIRAAEIIEEEKHAAVDKSHLEIWSGLFDVLSTEEFSAFYHALLHKRYHNEEIIMKKGAVQNSLFFINSGKVKLFYKDRDREVLVTTLQSGKVLGIGSFFDASVWTLSAAALGQVDVSILRFDKMQQWVEEYPSLGSKLHDFCLKFESVDDLCRASEKDRRRYKRYPAPAMRLTLSLLDSEGQSTGVNAKGDLADLSRGGGSFYMRISKKENARLLLGRSLKIMLPIEDTEGRPVQLTGVIVAVRAQHSAEYEYSVHVEFDSVLGGAEMQRLLRTS